MIEDWAIAIGLGALGVCMVIAAWVYTSHKVALAEEKTAQARVYASASLRETALAMGQPEPRESADEGDTIGQLLKYGPQLLGFIQNPQVQELGQKLGFLKGGGGE